MADAGGGDELLATAAGWGAAPVAAGAFTAFAWFGMGVGLVTEVGVVTTGVLVGCTPAGTTEAAILATSVRTGTCGSGRAAWAEAGSDKRDTSTTPMPRPRSRRARLEPGPSSGEEIWAALAILAEQLPPFGPQLTAIGATHRSAHGPLPAT